MQHHFLVRNRHTVSLPDLFRSTKIDDPPSHHHFQRRRGHIRRLDQQIPVDGELDVDADNRGLLDHHSGSLPSVLHDKYYRKSFADAALMDRTKMHGIHTNGALGKVSLFAIIYEGRRSVSFTGAYFC